MEGGGGVWGRFGEKPRRGKFVERGGQGVW